MKGLFYNPANRKMNSTFQPWGGRGGRGGYGRRGGRSGGGGGRDSGEYGERILQIEKIGLNEVGLTFQGFYDPNLKDKIKDLEFSRFDADRKAWIIPDDHKQEMIEKIAPHCLESNILLGEQPKFVENILSTPIPFNKVSKMARAMDFDYESERTVNKKSIEDLPPKIKDVAYKFQKQGIQYGIRKFGRMLLGDEMGVGKTVQAIGMAYLYKNDWPLLIITPASLKLTWRDELLNWLPSLRPNNIQLFKKGSEPINLDCCIFIMSYDLASKRYIDIQQKEFKAIIADEAHYLKSRDAKRCKNLIPILQQAKRVILLSGTPILNKPVEIYNLMKIIRPDVTPSFKEFTDRYCGPRMTPYGMDYSGATCTQELHHLL